MDAFTRTQLLALSEAFYVAHAAAFDSSRGHHPWPGWNRLVDSLAPLDSRVSTTLRVLDIGCGNARLARFLSDVGFQLAYLGVDSNEALLASARERATRELSDVCELRLHDFLGSERPGSDLPSGPFDLITLMGVLHHVPDRAWRLALLRAATKRLAPGGVLSLAAWQFADRDRFTKKSVDWKTLGHVLDRPIDLAQLEYGDRLLRFGDDPTQPPRYCHQVSDAEFKAWPEELGLEPVAEYQADGAEGNLNRYWVLKHT
jgi:SAM-dependent methyltransferase